MQLQLLSLALAALIREETLGSEPCLVLCHLPPPLHQWNDFLEERCDKEHSLFLDSDVSAIRTLYPPDRVGHLSFFKGMVPRRVPLPARQLREPTGAMEDQIDQQHFSFRLRLCGRRAWLARQWMLPRAAPESGTRGRISALPCLASPVSQYACCASASPWTSTATQRAFSRWPASRGGPGARAAVAVAAVVAATLCGSSLASARLHWRGAGVELGIAGRPEER